MRKQRYHAWKRMAACILTAAMMLTMPEATAFADETDASVTCTEKCEHHQEHTKDCGYTEGKEGVPCGHEHTKACYTLVKECVHEHEESCYQASEKNGLAETATPSDADKLEPTRCSHECSQDSGCITEKLDCAHKQGGEHDDTCGYAPAKETTPCGFTCEICQPQESGTNPEQISLLADMGNEIAITENCVFANGIPIVIKKNGEKTSIYDKRGSLLSGDTDVTDKWIFGGWSDRQNHTENTSVTMESGTVTKNIYGGSRGGTLEGSTEVIIKGGKVGWVYGGGENSTVNGTAKVTIHPGSKIWGSNVKCDTLDNDQQFNRGTVFGGGLGGNVKKTEVTLLGGDFGWAYGGGDGCTVDTTDIKLLHKTDLWCNVYGGGNGGEIKTANLTVRRVNNLTYTPFLFGGGWNDSVETANITIGGDCRLPGNIGIYASTKHQGNSSTVENVNFVLDHFEMVEANNPTVCGPLVGTNVTGTSTVLVTGSKAPTASTQLFSKDIDEMRLEQCSVVLLGADPSDPGNPDQPLEIGHLEVNSSGEAIFTASNQSVTIKELGGNGQLVFEGLIKQPAFITGVEQVRSTIEKPLQITGRGMALNIEGTTFISGSGITSAAGFLSGMSGYTAVNVDNGIQLKKSTEVKTPVQITRADFDKDSYRYGEVMNLSIEAKIAGGAPLAGETVYIRAGNSATQVASVRLDNEGKAAYSLEVNSFLRDILKDNNERTMRVYYPGSEKYGHDVSMMTLQGTNQQNFNLKPANIVLTQDIPAPALNQNPVRELKVGDAFFTAEVVWSPDHTAFQAETPYSAGILLKPRKSYDLTSIGSITYQGNEVIPQAREDGSLLLPNVKSFPAISVKNLDYDTEIKALDQMPPTLQEKFSGVDELKEAIYQEITQQMKEIAKENVVHQDVKLLVSLDGGSTWEPATEGNFPAAGIQVTLPYPAGTNKNTYDFVVAHMITRTMNGKQPGEIEFPAVEKTDSGITFRVYGLSPISVGWKQIKNENTGENGDGGSGGGSNKPDDTNKPDDSNKPNDTNKPNGSNSFSGSNSSDDSDDPNDSKDKGNRNRSDRVVRDSQKGYVNSQLGIITGTANKTAKDGYSHWMQDEHGWWLRFADNSYPKGVKHSNSGTTYAWELINGNWWAFDENGYSKPGWLRDDLLDGWFYIDTDRGMLTGWVQIQGFWYYLNPLSDGKRGIMYAGQRTPDGYYLNENGTWDGKEK